MLIVVMSLAQVGTEMSSEEASRAGYYTCLVIAQVSTKNVKRYLDCYNTLIE